MVEPNDLLRGFSIGELEALADCHLSAESRERLSDLLDRNRERLATPGEIVELDSLVRRVDTLSLLKARALLTLKRLEAVSDPA